MSENRIEKCYHHEYGGMVYQPRVPAIKRFIEPYAREQEAEAFLRGAEMMAEALAVSEPPEPSTDELHERIMRDICEADLNSAEKEDAVNLIHDDLYEIIRRALEGE